MSISRKNWRKMRKVNRNEKETASWWGEDMDIFLGLILVCVGVLIGILIVALMSANDEDRRR